MKFFNTHTEEEEEKAWPKCYRDLSPICLEGNQRMVFDRIESWVNNPGGPRICLLDQPAGKERSTIAGTIAGSMSEPGQLVAALFCSKANEDLKAIFSKLAVQLALKNREFRLKLIRVLEEASNPFLANLDKGKRAIVEPLESCRQNAEVVPITLIVIDALDVYEDPDPLQQFFKALEAVACAPEVSKLNLKIFMTADHQGVATFRRGLRLTKLKEGVDMVLIADQDDESGDIVEPGARSCLEPAIPSDQNPDHPM